MLALTTAGPPCGRVRAYHRPCGSGESESFHDEDEDEHDHDGSDDD